MRLSFYSPFSIPEKKNSSVIGESFFSYNGRFCYFITSLQVEFCAERKLLRNCTPFRADLKRSDYLIPTLYVLCDKRTKVPESKS